ncbi:MAG TPA: trehalose-phosphatase [Mycobacterium sp.]
MTTIDPRLHDAVLFALPRSDALSDLAQQLRDVGVRSTAASHAGLREAVRSLDARTERSVVVADDADVLAAAQSGGFSLAIGVGPSDLTNSGADMVVDDVADIRVRTSDRRMSEIPDALASYREVAEAIEGHCPAVCLDYDGTVSVIVAEPESARLVDGVADTLARLAGRCPVAILSGRDLADIRDRVNVAGLWYAGSHGFESVAPDGSYRQNEEAAAAVPVLEQAAADLRAELAHIDAARVEHKRFAVAVHYRDVSIDDIGGVVAITHRVGCAAHLRVTNGRKIVELRPDVDWNKGTTLAWIREQVTGTAGRPVLPIYIGDDLTDEDAFDAIHTDGISILVRHTEDGDRRSAARFTLENPEQVRDFLDRLADDLDT